MKRITGPAGLMVHGIHNYKYKALSQGSISVNNFEKIIIKLRKRIIDCDEWIKKKRQII